MPDQHPTVILSGFGDESANQKTAEQQFAAFAAIVTLAAPSPVSALDCPTAVMPARAAGVPTASMPRQASTRARPGRKNLGVRAHMDI